MDFNMTFFRDITIADFFKLVDRCKNLTILQIEGILNNEYGDSGIAVLAKTFNCDNRANKVATALSMYSNCGVW